MDSWYVRNWSLWHDIAIICETVPAVFKRAGAYEDSTRYIQFKGKEILFA